MPLPLETLASYVPALTVRRLVANPAALQGAERDSFAAGILLADISGFTVLTERYTQRGPEGAEELSRLLNAYFGPLIAFIRAHGGDIVKFAGDALLAVWPDMEGREDLATLTHRATQCSLAIKHMLLQGPAHVGEQLSMRIGIGAGTVTLNYVGGVYDRWELLVSSPDIVATAKASQYAKPGDVVLSPQAWSLLHEQAEGTMLADGHVRLEGLRRTLVPTPLVPAVLTPEMEGSLHRYLPGAIRARLLAGQISWLAELRRVTVVFINLPDLNDATPLDLAQTVMSNLQVALYHYEGSLNKFNVDEKGVALVAAYGLPPLSHEDDAVRGVQAALLMQAKLRDLGLASSFGIATGHAFCGEIGGGERREYTLIGDVVNLAARLMQAAGGGVLCDASTYQAAKVRLAFDALPAITVKGKQAPLAVYRPHGEAKSLVQPPDAIVGRVSERKALLAQLQNLSRQHAGSLIVLEGEAGIGKSRLLADLLQQANRLDVRCLVGSGGAVERSSPYHAWRPIVTQLFGLDTVGSDRVARQSHLLEQVAVDPDMVLYAPLLNTIVPLDLPDTKVTARVSGEARAENLHHVVLFFLQEAALQGPLLLVIEDAQWLDSASWVLLHQVIEYVEPLTVVLSWRARQDLSPSGTALLQQRPNAHVLKLAAMPQDEALQLVCQRLGVVGLPDPVARLITEKAEGHPFFSIELAHAMRDAGLIAIADGRCQLSGESDDLQALNLPNTVEGVITSRIDRLPPGPQLTLKVASVVGQVVPLELLAAIYPIVDDQPQIGAHVQTLCGLDILLPEGVEQSTFAFKQGITREVVYNLMLFSQRQQLHHDIAQWYERTHAEDLSPYFALLAHHWSMAQEADRAIGYFELAGNQALHHGAPLAASRFFGEALELDASSPRPRGHRWRAGLECLIGRAFLSTGRLAETKAHLERALDLSGGIVPQGGPRLVWELCRQAVRQFSWRGSLGAVSQDEGKDDASLESAEELQVYVSLLEMGVFGAPDDRWLHNALLVAHHAQNAGSHVDLATAYAAIALVAGRRSWPAVADAYRRLASEVVAHAGLVPEPMMPAFLIGTHQLGQGHLTAAAATIERAVMVCDRAQGHRQWGYGVLTLAQIYRSRGEFGHCLSLLRECQQAARQNDDVQMQAWCLTGQALYQLRVEPPGQFEEAGQLLDTAAALHEADIDPLERLNHGAARALRAVRLGDFAFAWEHAETVRMGLVPGLERMIHALPGLETLAQVYLLLWENAKPGASPRDADVRQVVALLQTCANALPVARPVASLYQGSFEWLSGKRAKAFHLWQRGLQQAEELGMAYEQALLHMELGRQLTSADPQAVSHLQAASVLWQRLGLAAEQARVLALIASSSQ